MKNKTPKYTCIFYMVKQIKFIAKDSAVFECSMILPAGVQAFILKNSLFEFYLIK